MERSTIIEITLRASRIANPFQLFKFCMEALWILQEFHLFYLFLFIMAIHQNKFALLSIPAIDRREKCFLSKPHDNQNLKPKLRRKKWCSTEQYSYSQYSDLNWKFIHFFFFGMIWFGLLVVHPRQEPSTTA